MNIKRSRHGTVILIGAALVGIAGCIDFGLVQVTGRGIMPSAYQAFYSPSANATFRFDADSCAGAVTGQFNYRDKYFPVSLNGKSVEGGVNMDGVVTEAIVCLGNEGGYYLCEACRNSYSFSPPFYAIEVAYRSGNPFIPGEGFADVCILEKREGVGAASEYRIAIRAENGPFAGYTNKGVAKGKIQSHMCK